MEVAIKITAILCKTMGFLLASPLFAMLASVYIIFEGFATGLQFVADLFKAIANTAETTIRKMWEEIR